MPIPSCSLFVAAVALWAQGCADEAPESGDGEECPIGDDCATPPLPDECQQGEAAPCFEGSDDLVGVGSCRSGQSRCVDGAFGACVGQVLPEAETCDGQDQDCDGTADEGLGDACAPCEGDCRRDGFGAHTDHPFVVGEDSQGVAARDGGLVLDTETVDVSFVWIANTDEGTVSKIDPRAGQEVGRYLSALPQPGLPEALQPCDENQGVGQCPSRTAVDLRGDVWVANRAFLAQGSVTKILAAGCPDRDGDGVITTSRDVDGDGAIDIGDPEEFPGARDECLALTAPIGSPNAKPRGLAVDPFHPRDHGSVWVGAYEDRQMHRVHGSTGEVLETVDLPIRPYGAVMTAAGVLWVTSLADVEDGIVSVDSATGRVGRSVPIQSSSACAGGYGIAVDASGRIWLGGWRCQAAFRYDPAEDAWRTYNLQRGYTRGVTVDGSGRVWIAHSHAGFPLEKIARVTSLNTHDGGDKREVDLPDAEETIGLGVDADGKIWAVNRGSNNAMRIDPDTREVLATVRTGQAPYTYSDFTGFGLRTFAAPFGSWRGDVSACQPSGAPTWDQLTWAADVPPSGRIAVWLRASYREDLLGSAPRLGPFDSSPLDLGALDDLEGRTHLRIEVELRTEDFDQSPTLRAVHAQYHCPSG